MSGFWPVFAIIVFIWLMTRRDRRRCSRQYPQRPDSRDEVIDRLSERVRALEKIITDNDWQLRRDIDGLGH